MIFILFKKLSFQSNITLIMKKALLIISLLSITLYSCKEESKKTNVLPSKDKVEKDTASKKETKQAEKPAPASPYVGVWKNISCDISFEVTENDKEYSYTYTSKERTLTGNVIVKEEDSETYITFEGIEWASYEGDVSNGASDQTLEKPTTIEGLYSKEDNSITIQNEGNAMNAYTVLDECSDKYMIFEKQ